MTEPKLTSFDIASMQLEICHLMDLAGQTEDPVLLADYDKMILETYERLGDSAELKLPALRAVSLRIDAEIETISTEIKSLQKAKRARVNASARVKSFATQLMSGLKSTKGVSTLRKDGHSYWTAQTWKLVAPKEVESWPEGWRKTKTTHEPDRAKARSELKAGADVPDGFAWESVEGIRWQ